jgi:hypothetical protein
LSQQHSSDSQHHAVALEVRVCTHRAHTVPSHSICCILLAAHAGAQSRARRGQHQRRCRRQHSMPVLDDSRCVC